MASLYGNCDFTQLTQLKDKLEKLTTDQEDEFIKSCAKELAARLLTIVIKNTPVGVGTFENVEKKVYAYKTENGKKRRYDTGKTKVVKATITKGGTLRRGWTAGKNISGTEYAKSLPIIQTATTYEIIIINNTFYASYVELGHRQRPGIFVPAIGKRLKKSWVPGKFILRDAEIKLNAQSPQILERKIKKYLEELFNE